MLLFRPTSLLTALLVLLVVLRGPERIYQRFPAHPDAPAHGAP